MDEIARNLPTKHYVLTREHDVYVVWSYTDPEWRKGHTMCAFSPSLESAEAALRLFSGWE